MKKKDIWIIPSLIALIELFVIVFLVINRGNYIKQYMVSFNTDGGNTIVSELINENSAAIRPMDPVREGFIFDGWFLGDVEYNFASKVVSDIEIKARWIDASLKRFTVKFNVDGEISSQVVIEGRLVIEPSIPLKSGYTFVEWQLNGVLFDFNTVISSDIELKAIFEKISNVKKYRVIFDSNGGSSISSQLVEEGNKVIRPKDPVKVNYNFVGWQLDGIDYTFLDLISNDITLKAVWEEKEKYTVTFNPNGGSAADSRLVYAGSTLGELIVPIKDGFVFDGWYYGKNKASSSTVVNANIVLNASWKTVEQYNMEIAKEVVKDIEITKGGQTLNYSSNGCTINLIPSVSIDTIERKLNDTNIDITANIRCGSLSDVKSIKGIIKKSTYKYNSVANDNQLNCNVKVIDALSSYDLYSIDDVNYNFAVGEYNTSCSCAIVDNNDIGSSTNFKMIYRNDPKTIYYVSR